MPDPRPAPTISARQIDALLPQTQCGQCGFKGCLPYAEALASGCAAINRCPPGGDAGVAKLAQLLGLPTLPLDPGCGQPHPRQLARIVEADCIGCTKCIQACPVDAIIGTSKAMHTVISDLCTGCELCVPACPVDCISLEPMPAALLDQAHADQARQRHQRHQQRLATQAMRQSQALQAQKTEVTTAALSPVQAALARRKARQQTPELP